MDKATLNKVARIVKANVGDYYTIGRIGGIGNAHKQSGVVVSWAYDHVQVTFCGFYLGDIAPALGTPASRDYWTKVRDIMAPAREALIAEGFNVEGDTTISINKPERQPIDLDALLHN